MARFSLDPLSEQGGAQGIPAELEVCPDELGEVVGVEIDEEIDTSVCWASMKARMSSWPGKPS